MWTRLRAAVVRAISENRSHLLTGAAVLGGCLPTHIGCLYFYGLEAALVLLLNFSSHPLRSFLGMVSSPQRFTSGPHWRMGTRKEPRVYQPCLLLERRSVLCLDLLVVCLSVEALGSMEAVYNADLNPSMAAVYNSPEPCAFGYTARCTLAPTCKRSNEPSSGLSYNCLQ